MGVVKNFGETEQLSITILVDNKADLIVKSTETVEYFTDEPLLAEHGFSALLRLGQDEQTILWDGGVSRVALIENLRRMNVNLSTIRKVALSHGHFDHFAALSDVLMQMELSEDPKEWEEPVTAKAVENWLQEQRIPLVAHPAAFRERWWVTDDGTMTGPISSPPRQEWEALGAKIVLSEKPYQLGPGCWTTGFVPRESGEESGRPKQLYYRQGDDFLPDDMEDDQAIVIHVKDKGLVILSGCAHSGIVNTVNHAKAMSGIDRVWAVIGGFHLARSTGEDIQYTVDELKKVVPQLIVPCHCTGLSAISQFAQQMPDVFVEGVVGATYVF
jgi:7,8-dihydropterin-6-yl-methyl-4-(beta-D-ribofuranosyl)aminobenzene 5'-phosphate synthase